MHKKAKEASFVYEMKRSGTSNHNNASIGAVESSTSKIATATMKTKKKVVMMK